MNGDRSGAVREWALVAGVYAAMVVIAAAWLAVDRTPPEWDHANHLERVVHCAEDLARRDVRTIVERSSFYPPLVPCAAAVLYRPDFTMKGPGELRELFAAAGLTDESRAITYCGVGISASALLFALHRAGFEDARLYDASWEEWGRDPTRPVARDA